MKKLAIRYLSALIILFLFASSAYASHFRFAHTYWRRVADNSNGSVTIEFRTVQAWRTGSVTTSPMAMGDGNSVTATATTIGAFTDITGDAYTVIRYSGQHTYSAAAIATNSGVFTVGFSGCCRVSALVNAADESYIEQFVVDLNNGNLGSPVSSMPAVLQMKQGVTNTVPLPISDPDGDAVTCRLATAGESGISTQPTAGGQAIAVSSGCQLSWNASGTSNGQKYAVAIILEENHASGPGQVQLDFVIEITSSNLPTCAGTIGGVSVNQGQSFSLIRGEALAGTLIGTDPGAADLTTYHYGLPTGATLTPLGSAQASPATSNFAWTSSAATIGAHAILGLFQTPTRTQGYCTFSVQVKADNDAIVEMIDLDDDNDGIPDATEGAIDTDADGIVNSYDDDDDGDGIRDIIEAGGTDNGQGFISGFVDTNSNGLSDTVEVGLGGTPLPLPDTDSDTIKNYLDTDSDGDNIPDSEEGTGDSDSNTVPNYLDPDTTAPAAPVVSTPSAGTTTSDNTPTFSGTAEDLSTVKVYRGATLIGQTTAASGGAWSYTPVSVIPDGTYSITATATDRSLNLSSASTPFSLTIDTIAPGVPVITIPADGGSVNDATPTISGTAEAFATIAVYDGVTLLGTTTADSTGAWSYVPSSPLSESAHTFKARATDAANNSGSLSAGNAVTIDITAPAAPSVTYPADGSTTPDKTPTISGTGEVGGTVSVYVDGNLVGTTTVAGDGSWSFTPLSDLTPGDRLIVAKVTDVAGNSSANSVSKTVKIDCPDGFYGATCVNSCPGGSGSAACNGHGDCSDGLTGTGSCLCDGNYFGDDCSHNQQACSIDLSDGVIDPSDWQAIPAHIREADDQRGENYYWRDGKWSAKKVGGERYRTNPSRWFAIREVKNCLGLHTGAQTLFFLFGDHFPIATYEDLQTDTFYLMGRGPLAESTFPVTREAYIIWKLMARPSGAVYYLVLNLAYYKGETFDNADPVKSLTLYRESSAPTFTDTSFKTAKFDMSTDTFLTTFDVSESGLALLSTPLSDSVTEGGAEFGIGLDDILAQTGWGLDTDTKMQVSVLLATRANPTLQDFAIFDRSSSEASSDFDFHETLPRPRLKMTRGKKGKVMELKCLIPPGVAHAKVAFRLHRKVPYREVNKIKYLKGTTKKQRQELIVGARYVGKCRYTTPDHRRSKFSPAKQYRGIPRRK
jgi:hypothetical protein